ncbi:MAG: hypothetical protein ACN6O6_24040 [Pseudomonas sp.]|uniref:hypothetical protein n=1 Tax=Pseudomonas sp. TaxID=306 RepID=UPI003D0EFB1E
MSNDLGLTLHRRLRTPDQASLHCRELDLRLTDDGQHLVLCRYVELYRDDRFTWGTTHHHRVPLLNVVRWMVRQGE